MSADGTGNRLRWFLIAALAASVVGLWLWVGDEEPVPPEETPPVASSPARPEPAADEPEEAVAPAPRAVALSPSTVKEVSDPFGAFAGRVVSSRTGQGVAGAELTFETGGAAFSTTARAEGAFEFRPTRAGSYRLAAITARGHLPFGPEWGHSPVSLTAIEGRRVEGLAFFLAPAIELRGRVVSPDGRPVPGATVRVVESEQSAISTGASPSVSDPEGGFTFTAAEGDHLVATHPSYAEGRAMVGPRAALGEPVRIALKAAGSEQPSSTLSGRVLDERGQPVPDALVSATLRRRGRDRFGDEVERPESRTVTDPQGQFALEGIVRGRYDVRAFLEGVGRGAANGVRTPASDVTVTLARGARIRGSVRGDDGAPVAAFTVDLQRVRGPMNRDSYVTTAVIRPDGKFELEGIAPGKYVIQVAAHGFALSEEREVVVAKPPVDVGPIDIRLERGGRVHGVVRSADTRRPLAGALVSLEGGVESSTSALPVMASTSTDAAGRFELGGLAQGLRSITVMAQGHHGRVLSGLQIQNDGAIGPLDVMLTPVAPGEEPAIELVGIGAVLTPRGEALFIGRLLPGGGAAEAGIRERDEILQIDGVRVAALGFEGAVNRIRGPEGSKISLLIQRPSEPQSQEVVVIRRRVRQ